LRVIRTGSTNVIEAPASPTPKAGDGFDLRHRGLRRAPGLTFISMKKPEQNQQAGR
jgi:hypothetical protein